ncbi:MAG: two-component system response regulator [gamma proteobacterium symbiont of Ctena orbiculata]|nr:MAG: two-component system response regulator [gamma proteobacterium symbiont of Ctena orbiculata]
MNITDLSVILVEPSLTQRKLIAQLLGGLGIDNIEAYTLGGDALQALPVSKPDLIISSLYLPDMTGTDLVYKMRNDDELIQSAFMLISSETSLSYLDPIRQAGAVAILPKPFSQDDLYVAMQATLDYVETPNLELQDLDTEVVRILIVDDSSMSRKHIRRILEAMDIENITEATDGAEAAQLINEHFFDLVISDYNMPEMNGQELIDYIRTQSGQPGLPVLMVTSESNENRLAAVQKSGVSAICDKPFTTETIQNFLQQILQDL